jgi:signal transduction histidine kinase
MSRFHPLAPRWPRRTVRLRLTLLYGSLFLISGLVLLGLTYALVARATGDLIFLDRPTGAGSASGSAAFFHRSSTTSPPFAVASQAQIDRLRAQLSRQHASDLHQLLIQSGIALAGVALLSLVLGWLVAGRALRPLRTMTAAARRISQRNLHERLAVQGPADELKDLGDTVDDLLGRLESAFEAQRRFVANASHELRTPLTLGRALLEDHLADPNATPDSFRTTSERLLAISEHQERLLEALLTLASSERGLERREYVDLATVTDHVIRTRQPEIARRKLQITAPLEPAPVLGDPRLLERLVANLVDNALRHNSAHGRVRITSATEAGHAILSVTNSGPVVPAAEVTRLLQPFQQLRADRTGHGDGYGLGLSIVEAIAAAHDATLTAQAQPRGGLAIEVSFPAAGAHTEAHSAQPAPAAGVPARRSVRPHQRRHLSAG